MQRFSTSLLGEAKTLLLATDCSHFSDGAVQEAIFFGQACGAQVIALHVVRVDAESLRAADAIVVQRRQEVMPYIEQLRRMAQDSGVQLEVVVIGSGSPGQAIIEQARLRNADVILMGRRGKSSPLSRLVGSMTARVIGLGFPRVLVVPEDFLITGAHVLLVQDDSENSRLAAGEALSLCSRCTTLQRLTVLAVAGKEQELEKARLIVEEVCRRAQGQATGPVCEPLALLGDPTGLVVETAREKAADMILLGCSDKPGLAARLLGHLAENVIGRAHCAVLVVNT
jgi:nucleotide-binding universal stress UspA family protein